MSSIVVSGRCIFCVICTRHSWECHTKILIYATDEDLFHVSHRTIRRYWKELLLSTGVVRIILITCAQTAVLLITFLKCVHKIQSVTAHMTKCVCKVQSVTEHITKYVSKMQLYRARDSVCVCTKCSLTEHITKFVHTLQSVMEHITKCVHKVQSVKERITKYVHKVQSVTEHITVCTECRVLIVKYGGSYTK